MGHRRFTHFFRRRSPAARIVAAALACGLPRLLHAQSSQPAQDVAPALAPYRTPVIALVQPTSGGAIPRDKPVVVFRLAQGEPSDGIDAKSLTVTVDGIDVTPAFQLAGNDAWGSLAGAASASPLDVGVHQVIARICSARGACGSVSAAVTIAAVAQPTIAATEPTTKRGRIAEFVIRVTEKLLLP